MDFKAAYRRFKQWQQAPFDYSYNQESHHCNNCGNEYVGNFCPACSQKAYVGPITWRSVAQSVGELWGMHNRSLLYSWVQLLLRPGYFIGDYISGKKQVSFPPVKMLALTALLGVVVDFLTGRQVTGMFNNDFDFAGDKMLWIDNAFEWMNLHPDVMTMILLSYLIIPNFFIFRSAPKHPRHTLPQGFFIQIFSAVFMLIINMFDDVTSLHWVTLALVNIWLYCAYKQLFGYSVWGTIWRLVLTFLCAHLLALIILGIDFSIHMMQNGATNPFAEFKLFIKLLTRMVTNSDM